MYTKVSYRVPHCSLLGPMVSTLNMLSFDNIIRKQYVNFHGNLKTNAVIVSDNSFC